MMAAVAFAVGLTGAASGQQIRTTLDGEVIHFPDVQPMMMANGRVMVPIRGVFERMNATLIWDPTGRTVVTQRGPDTIILPLDSHYATVNGKQFHLDAPARMYMGRTMVPLRFISETLGARVNWFREDQTVAITSFGNGLPPSRTISPGGGSQGSSSGGSGAGGSTSGDGGTQVLQNGDAQPESGGPASREPVAQAGSISKGTVIVFQLNETLSSSKSAVGDRFTASPILSDSSMYKSMLTGVVLEGHVNMVRGRTLSYPGVLGLTFDRARTPDGSTYAVYGSLIGLDSGSVANYRGRWFARQNVKASVLKYVSMDPQEGTQAGPEGAGTLMAVSAARNARLAPVMGPGTGLVIGIGPNDRTASTEANLPAGTHFGVAVDHELKFRDPVSGS